MHDDLHFRTCVLRISRSVEKRGTNRCITWCPMRNLIRRPASTRHHDQGNTASRRHAPSLASRQKDLGESNLHLLVRFSTDHEIRRTQVRKCKSSGQVRISSEIELVKVEFNVLFGYMKYSGLRRTKVLCNTRWIDSSTRVILLEVCLKKILCRSLSIYPCT